jgi:hypothetical protein
MNQDGLFKGRQVTAEVILWAVRWNLQWFRRNVWH